MLNNRMKSSCAHAAVALALLALSFLLAMQATVTPWCEGAIYTDSSVFRYVAMEMVNGGMPYADTFDHKGPLLYLINYVGMRLDYLRGVWFIEFASIFAAQVFMYKAARLKCARLISLDVVVIADSMLFGYFEGGNLTEEYALPFWSFSLWAFLDYLLNGETTRVRIACAGACFACVLLLRANMVAVWVVFPIAILAALIRKRAFRDAALYAGLFFLGAALVLLPVFAWLWVGGAFGDFVRDYVLFNLRYSHSGLLSRWNSLQTFLDSAILLVSLAGLIADGVKSRSYATCVYAAFFFVAILLVCLPGNVYMHYGMVLVPAAVYPLSLIGSLLVDDQRKVAQAVSSVAICYLLIACAFAPWMNGIGEALKSAADSPSKQASAALRTTVDRVTKLTGPDDVIAVFGNWDAVYVLAGRMSATRYSYTSQISVDARMAEEYWDDLDADPPKVIVVQAGRFQERLERFLERETYVLDWQEKDDGSGAKVFARDVA